MKNLLLIQSQEHDKLPLAELNAVMETENIIADVEEITPGLVLLKNINDETFNHSYKRLTDRLAYTHEVHQLLKTTNTENLNETINNIDWSEYIKKNFVVRVKRFHSDIDTVKTERTIGGIILDSTPNIKVKLENSDSFIRIVSYENTIFICYQKFKLNKKHFEEIKPHKRPFFYPGSMSPKLARCMVNLSRIKEGELLLDPFCGTGGILIEAGLIGAKLVGSDINWKMKNGSAVNLDFCGIEDYKTYKIDFRKLKMLEPANAVVTDPPYGISTTTGGVDTSIIFGEFLESLEENIKPDALIVTASPHYIDINPIIEEKGFKLLEHYEIKMHRSLTRIISVIAKK
jgi:tRNA (guanine10-N2)-dimethyltransferase